MAKDSGLVPNPAQLKSKLDTIIRELHEDSDPNEMNAYRRFFRRNVSIFSRGYVIGYLLKTLSEQLPSDGSSERKRRKGGRADREESTQNTLADAKTLFVSVGKNRRVFPRDLIGFIVDTAAIDSSQIGQIKVLDNYSFVEIEPVVAERVIEVCNGQEFRGRKLTVNFARNKKA